MTGLGQSTLEPSQGHVGQVASGTKLGLCKRVRNRYQVDNHAEEAERFYEDLQDLLELTPKKDVLFIIGDWNAKVASQETPGVTGELALEYGRKQGKD